MSPDAVALLRELADRSPAEREEYCARHAVSPALRAEVESLLHLDDGRDTVPDRAAAAGRRALSPDIAARAMVATKTAIHPRFAAERTADEGRLSPGTLLAGRYRIVTLVGRGGMGEVYRADDLTLKQPVALKFLPQNRSGAPVLLERLHAEVRLARQVSHPNVCRVYDLGIADGLAFISMEYIDGEDLASLLRRIGRLPQPKAIEVARCLCAGLAAAHHKGVIHGDLKPANVMIDGRGQVLITDFGLAAPADDDEAAARGGGTPAYMAPELLRGEGASVRSDLYALGLVLHEVFIGTRPSATDAATTARRAAGDVDAAVMRAIASCLDADPRRRPASALAVASMLPGGHPLADALAAGITPPPDVVAASRETHAMSVRAIVATLLVVIGGIVATTLLSERVSLLAMTPFENPPEVLEQRARDIVAAFGYSRSPADSAAGFSLAGNYRRYAELHTPATEYRAQLTRGQPPLLFFWYRQSNQPLEALNPRAFVDFIDPPLAFPGEVLVWIDPQGRLMNLQAVLSQNDYSREAAQPPDWNALFAAAGIDPARFTPAEPQWIPPATFDARAAWTGTYAHAPSLPLRIEAAAWKGRPVFFRIVGPWTSFQAEVLFQTGTMDLVRWLWIILLVALLGAGAFVAHRNFRSGRGDIRGAFRLASLLMVVALVDWILTSHGQVTPAGVPAVVWAFAYGSAFAVAALVFYVAVEPFARRHWPQALITWTRALAGDVREPLVGAHVLAGAAFGVTMAAWWGARNVAFLWVGAVDSIPHPAALEGGGATLALVLELFLGSIVTSLGLFVLLLTLWLLLRRRWLAAIAFIVVEGAVPALATMRPAVDVAFMIPLSALTVWVMMRFGVLPLVVGRFVAAILIMFPITSQWSAWYVEGTFVAAGIVLLLAAWSCRVALAGRTILRDELLEPAR